MMTPPRVVRRRHGLLAALAAVFFLLGLLGVEHRDDAWLLNVGGSVHDLNGDLRVAWADLGRDCSSVMRPVTGSPVVAAALTALQDFSPPDSRSARLLAADLWMEEALDRRLPPTPPQPAGPGAWVALQATFDDLEPVVVLVRWGPEGAQLLPQGVWSGTTRPWNAAWRIRGFLKDRADGVPDALLACLDPHPIFEQPPMPLRR